MLCTPFSCFLKPFVFQPDQLRSAENLGALHCLCLFEHHFIHLRVVPFVPHVSNLTFDLHHVRRRIAWSYTVSIQDGSTNTIFSPVPIVCDRPAGFDLDDVPQVFQDKLQAWMKFKAISLEERNFDLSNDLVRHTLLEQGAYYALNPNHHVSHSLSHNKAPQEHTLFMASMQTMMILKLGIRCWYRPTQKELEITIEQQAFW